MIKKTLDIYLLKDEKVYRDSLKID